MPLRSLLKVADHSLDVNPIIVLVPVGILSELFESGSLEHQRVLAQHQLSRSSAELLMPEQWKVFVIEGEVNVEHSMIKAEATMVDDSSALKTVLLVGIVALSVSWESISTRTFDCLVTTVQHRRHHAGDTGNRRLASPSKHVTVSGIVTNCLLIYCIRRHTKLSLGAYKQLLTIFASFDSFLTALHAIIDPKILIVNSTFGIISNSPFLTEDRELPSFYCSCFSVPFALMNIHFLYRYWTVSRPHLIPHFSSKIIHICSRCSCCGRIHCLVSAMSAWLYNSAVELLSSEFESRLGKNLTRGWIVMDWNDPAELPRLFPSFLIFDSIMIIPLSMAFTLGILTGIRCAWKISRSSSANLQLRLFIAVIAQTLVPLVCVYFPYFCCITLTYLHLPVSVMAYLCFFLTSCFPAWDAIIIILLMSDYRHAVLNMLKRLRPTTIEGISQTSMVRQAIEDAHGGKFPFIFFMAGILTNCLLIYCIRRHTKLSLGAYKQLLTIFASFDLYLTTLHALIDPVLAHLTPVICDNFQKILIVNSTFGLNSNSPFLPVDRALPSFYCSCYSVPFALMNIHFLYRYWTVSRPHLIRLFSSKLFISGLVTVTAGEFVAWFLLCQHGLSGEVYNSAVELLRSEFERRYGKNRTEGWVVMDWNDPAELPRLFPSFIVFDSIMLVSLSMALTLGGIQRAWKTSRSSANLQLRLFIAVIAQTLVPSVCVYFPFFCCVTLPFLRVDASVAADLCFFLTSCFPAWDAVIVIFLMADYRHAVANMMGRLKPTTIPGLSQTSMVMTIVRSCLLRKRHSISSGLELITLYTNHEAYFSMITLFDRCGLGRESTVWMQATEAIEKTHLVAGIVTNVVLLYCIRRHTRLSLGAYKQLLTIFASFDLFLTILHGVIEPKMIIIDSVFGIHSANGFMDRMVVCLYCSCFSVPFALLNIHFLYRYWTASRPHLIRLFSSKPFIVLLVALPIMEFIVWFLLCMYGLSGQTYDRAVEILRTEFELRYEQNVTEGWIIMNWQNRSETARLVPTLLAYDIIMAISLTLAVTLGILTFNGIRRTWKVSRSKANLQLRLFIAVIAQTLVPFVCVYFPYFCVLTFTPLRLPVSGMADLCFFLTSCFPAWDAVIIITLMTDYRHAVTSQFSRFIKPATLPGMSQMTTMVWSRVGIAGSSAQPSMWRRETTTVMVNLTFSSNWVCGTVSNRAVSGVSLNLILLFAIRRFTKTSVGSYKYLLTAFASYDIFLSVLHAAVKPRAIIIGSIYGMCSLSEDRVRQRITSVYCACFTVPFALMIIHFLYRFWSIRYPHLIALFSNKRFVAAISTYPVLQFVEWYMFAYYGTTGEGPEIGKVILSEESARRFEKGLQEGWLIFNYWVCSRSLHFAHSLATLTR
ncbi:hypothetical protein PRIPAC_77535 [Pristionchus pacificus]|uniref:Serpentine receptor class r-10 n=1 Tax=Pristionchus pacificus TaxID=54126 RepID=A0A2A6CQR8_PRIPA|nr:hypothetical protein PRIPAC_77535 [Pristionchus pacificus]|eukprot:PDM80436.1 G protein-coupled receptor [Pristionchus pacificus]